MKRLIERFLRCMKLEVLIYYYLFCKDLIRNRRDNRSFLHDHPLAIVPPPLLRFDVTATTNLRGYYTLGLATARVVYRAILEHYPKDQVRIYEWGCGPGRVISQLLTLDRTGRFQLMGSDYVTSSIRWARTAFPSILFKRNGLHPPVPFPEQSVDFAYAISVFTHLSERSHYLWLEEILRVLRPGGIFFFTTHGEFYRVELKSQHDQFCFDAGEYVALTAAKDGSQLYCAFHSIGFMKKFLNNVDILAHIPQGLDSRQDIWIIQKRYE